MKEEMLVLYNDRKLYEGIDYTYTSGYPETIEFFGLLRGPLWLRRLYCTIPPKIRRRDRIEIHYESVSEQSGGSRH